MSRSWDFDGLHPDAFRSLVEGVPAILYIDRPDESSTNLYTSPQAEELLGYPLEEWLEDSDLWFRILHPDDRQAAIRAHTESNEKRERFLEEYRVIAKDGRIVWIRDEAVPVRDRDGTLLFWRGVMLDITDRREAEEKLRWSLDVLRRTLQQRRELARRLETAQEQERRRIAADIHDDPIQAMSAVDMRLQMLTQFPETLTADHVVEIERDVYAAIERLRSLLFELRPTALDREGLASALHLYLDHTARQAGWTVDVHADVRPEPDPELRALLYRIAQEAVTNVRKHADASHVSIDLETAKNGVMMRVRDDGRGFSHEQILPARPGHLGITTLTERAELAGGWARVDSEVGKGTTVECWLPLDIAGGDPGLSA